MINNFYKKKMNWIILVVKDSDQMIVVEIDIDQIKETLIKIHVWSFFDIFYRIIKFNPNYWNCFSGEKYQLNCLSGKKYRLNYRGGKKCRSNGEIYSLK